MASPSSTWRPWAAPALGLTSVAFLAVALRLPQFLLVPHWTDETSEVLWAWAIAFEGARPLTHTDAYNGPFWPYALALALRLFGPSAALPRWFALGLGLATVAATSALGWQLARRQVRSIAAVVAGLVLATAFTHALVNSRVAWSNSSTPLWTTLTAIALLAAVRRDGYLVWLAAGTLGGLALHTHPSVTVYLAGLALWSVLDRGRRVQLRRPGPWLAILAATLIYSPVLVHNVSHGFATVAEAMASRNFGAGDNASWPVGVLALLAQLGRSLSGGFNLDAATPTWTALTAVYAVLALAGPVLAARQGGGPAGKRLPLTIVGLSVLALPLFNNNWHGLLEARYLGFTWPFIAAAWGLVLAETWSHARRPARAALATATLIAFLVPAARLWQYDQAALDLGFDNRRLWSILSELRMRPVDNPVLVDQDLREVAWRAGGHPRRAVEYLLTLEGIPHRRTNLAGLGARLDAGGDHWLLLSGPTVAALAARHRLIPINTEARPGEGAWGLYLFQASGPASP